MHTIPTSARLQVCLVSLVALVAASASWAQTAPPAQSVPSVQAGSSAPATSSLRAATSAQAASAVQSTPAAQTSLSAANVASPPSTGVEPYGWPWLVQALERLRPETDTALPETSTEAAQRFERMIANGQAAAALTEINQRLHQREASTISGVDARLVFLRARALATLGQLDAAREAYRDMTVRFPELPEPWNNLAAVHAAQNQPQLAYEALQMAILTDPDYAAAHANMGDVLLMLAEQAYARAANLGAPQADLFRKRTGELLQQALP